MTIPPPKEPQAGGFKKWFKQFSQLSLELQFEELAHTSLLEEIYKEVADELEEGNVRKGLWAKCMAEANQNEDIAKSSYFKLRVQARLNELEFMGAAQAKAKEEAREAEKKAIEAAERAEAERVTAKKKKDREEAIQKRNKFFAMLSRIVLVAGILVDCR